MPEISNMILLADKNSKAWTFAEKIQNYIYLKKGNLIPLKEVEITHFRNGELNAHVPENVRKKDVYFIHDSTKNPQEWWVELILIRDLLLSSSVGSVTLVLPNMLYSRQDRKDKPHVPISARALAESISSGVSRIITMDLHAPQIQGFYPATTPLDNLYSFSEAVDFLRKNFFEDMDNLAIIATDAGGAGRARAFLKNLNKMQEHNPIKQKYSLALMDKIRPKAGEIEEMQLIGDVANSNVLVIEDIIDSGGTLCKAAEVLKKNGAKKLFCYATHGIFTKGIAELCSYYDVIITSNTHYQENPNVKIVDVSPLFAEAIYRAQKGLSISELFR